MKLKSVFEEYRELWPAPRLKELEPLLSKIYVARYPRDVDLMRRLGMDPRSVVIVIDGSGVKELLPLFEAGYRHFVQEKREDFASELLAASLMVWRPQAFNKNPIRFFFSGFDTGLMAKEGREIRLSFKSNTQKDVILERLSGYLDNSREMASIKDICLQAADEMFSNAVFGAPVDGAGTRINQGADRRSVAWLRRKGATLFSCYSDTRVIIGCEDPYGSLREGEFIQHLHAIYRNPTTSVRRTGAGAGLGVKFLIENSANFYLLTTPGERTLVACGFLLKGLKANLMAKKHFHLSFGQ